MKQNNNTSRETNIIIILMCISTKLDFNISIIGTKMLVDTV